MINPHKILQVGKNACPSVIKAAYKVLIKKTHPDHDGGSSEKAAEINEAYRCLTENDYESDIPEFGSYDMIEKIATGGFGETYKVKHRLLKEFACLKLCAYEYSEEMNKVLLEEAKVVWDLRHYSIPAIRDVLMLEDKRLAIITSYIAGPTLVQVIEKIKTRLDPEHVSWILERVINGLAYLHMHGIVHGDIKPHNIIVQPKTHMATMVDFGLSHDKPGIDNKPKGYTEVFSPPEQIEGFKNPKLKRPLLPESDFYALGMTAIYLLNGSIERTQRKELPDFVPAPMRSFLKELTKANLVDRPDPSRINIQAKWQEIRKESFGSTTSGMKPIPGF